MTPNLSRRAALCGIATLPVIGASASPLAVAVTADFRSDTIAELVADYWLKHAEYQSLNEQVDTLVEQTVLPKVQIERGRKLVGYDRETRLETFEPRILRCEKEIRDHYRSYPVRTDAENEAYGRECRVALAELAALQARYREACESAGIVAADKASDLAYRQLTTVWNQILRTRPATIAEAECRSRFILQMIRTRREFNVGELALLFGASEAQARALANIEWVREMQSRRFKFEYRSALGPINDLDSYSLTKSASARDDTNALLDILKARAA